MSGGKAAKNQKAMSSPAKQSLEEIFVEIKNLLEKHLKGLNARDSIIDSQAKIAKQGYHLYGKKDVSIFEGRRPQPTYLAGVILQKNFIGFYSMPTCSHPQLVQPENPQLRKFKKGISCFNVTRLDESIIRDIDRILREGKKIYKELGWI